MGQLTGNARGDGVGAMKWATVDELLSTTRAVKRRLDLDRPVDLGTVRSCLALATQAPVGHHDQDWRFIVVTDPGTRARLGELYRIGFDRYAASLTGASDGSDQDNHRVGSELRESLSTSALFLLDNYGRVPVLVVACFGGPWAQLGNTFGWASTFGSIFPAVWSFQLALRSRDLGSTITTMHLWCEREVSERLQIPDGYTQACMIPVAHTVGTRFRPARRRSIDDVTWLNSWGSRLPSPVDAAGSDGTGSE